MAKTQAIAEKSLSNESFRKAQLERLHDLDPATFDGKSLYHLIADFLIKPESPDLRIAKGLLERFALSSPGVDSNGELSTLYFIKMLEHDAEALSTSEAVKFFAKILTIDPGSSSVKVKVSSFMIELIWQALISKKDDVSGAEMYRLCLEHSKRLQEGAGFAFDLSFQDTLLRELFLPRLNWTMIDEIVQGSARNGQISLPSTTLDEVFQVVLDPTPEDSFVDSSDLFTRNVVKPRFHRFVALLERWKSAGISLKGKEMSSAFEITFKRFLPTEGMMSELENLA